MNDIWRILFFYKTLELTLAPTLMIWKYLLNDGQCMQWKAICVSVDSALTHMALVTQEWVAENFYDNISPNIWPPNTPTLNPLDYYMLSVVKREGNEHARNTKVYLKAARVRVMLKVIPAYKLYRLGHRDARWLWLTSMQRYCLTSRPRVRSHSLRALLHDSSKACITRKIRHLWLLELKLRRGCWKAGLARTWANTTLPWCPLANWSLDSDARRLTCAVYWNISASI